MLINHLGEKFQWEQIWVDGITCRFCFRVIRVREKAGRFDRREANGRHVTDYECIECMRLSKEQKDQQDPTRHAFTAQSLEDDCRLCGQRYAAHNVGVKS